MGESTLIVVSALVRDCARILLVEEREPGELAATWMLPGGKVERGETVTAALSRELRDETGLEVVADPSIAFMVEAAGHGAAYLFDRR
jgi:8-oxo-dGTP diphosphatase